MSPENVLNRKNPSIQLRWKKRRYSGKNGRISQLHEFISGVHGEIRSQFPKSTTWIQRETYDNLNNSRIELITKLILMKRIKTEKLSRLISSCEFLRTLVKNRHSLTRAILQYATGLILPPVEVVANWFTIVKCYVLCLEEHPFSWFLSVFVHVLVFNLLLNVIYIRGLC